MLTSTVSVDGQTTVPPEIRKALKAPPGTILGWAVNGGSVEVVPLTAADQHKRVRCDYDACLESLKESPAIPDHLLILRRSKET